MYCGAFLVDERPGEREGFGDVIVHRKSNGVSYIYAGEVKVFPF